MIDINKIRQVFTPSEGERLIALDWDADIVPLFKDSGKVSFNTLKADDIETVMKSFLALPGLNEATDIVFNLSVREQYCCKLWQMALYANELCNIPSQPSVAWGYTKSPDQPVNIKIDVIYK